MSSDKLQQHALAGESLLERSAALQTGLRDHIAAQPAERFLGRPWDLVAEIERYADEKRLPMIFRAAKIATARAALAAMSPRPRVVVEFGTFVGTSALAWAAMLRDFHGADPAPPVRVFSLEADPAVAAVARALVAAAGLQDVVEVVVGAGADGLRGLAAAGRLRPGGVDVVFLDHWEPCYLPDLRLCEALGLLRAGSLAVADNTDLPGAPDYLAYVRSGGGGGPVRYETRSLRAATTHGPSIVEVSEVVAV